MKERLEVMCCTGSYVKRVQFCQICPGDHEIVERLCPARNYYHPRQLKKQMQQDVGGVVVL
ncbi:hypothetical protein PHMEG_00034982 [Phytophthora megakarya]|uniref:Uncharacterized protein n=1 Tax=Phytophthora megakarya TaxID=4795 RepID=A0A225UPT5_9STRA|nr:hypothetical protein PHMEG_00034982 [Phytophthora megakarya]